MWISRPRRSSMRGRTTRSSPPLEGRGRAAGIERAGQTDGAREAPETPFGQVKRSFLVQARGRQFPPDDHHGVQREQHAQGARIDARQVHHDLDSGGGLPDVHGRRAFPSRDAGRILVQKVPKAHVRSAAAALENRIVKVAVDVRHSGRIGQRHSGPGQPGGSGTPKGKRAIGPQFQDELRRIAADRVSGAAALVLRGIEVLRAAGDNRPLRLAIAGALAEAQPTMAGFRTVSALVAASADPLRDLDVMSQRIRRAPASIARVAVPLIRLRSSTGVLRVVTCSRSATVERCLIELGRAEPVQVCCAESRPGGEGIALAEALGAESIQVELYSDAGIGTSIPGADAVVVGADAVSRAGFINKVGTAGVVALARMGGVPVFVLAGREKVLPDEVFHSLALTEEAPDDPQGSRLYRQRNPCFERIPGDPGDLVVTDTGSTSVRADEASSSIYMSVYEAYICLRSYKDAR